MTLSPHLAQRYGRNRGSRRRDRWIFGSVAVAFALVFIAWIVWAGLDGTRPTVDARDTGYTIVDDHTVEISYEVSVPAGERAACALQALNESFTIVGWNVVDLPPSERVTRAFTDTVATIEPSNTGLIYQCWLV